MLLATPAAVLKVTAWEAHQHASVMLSALGLEFAATTFTTSVHQVTKEIAYTFIMCCLNLKHASFGQLLQTQHARKGNSLYFYHVLFKSEAC